MLLGVQTTKPDIHIRRFVGGVVQRAVSDVEALELLEKAARYTDFRLRRSIMKSGNSPPGNNGKWRVIMPEHDKQGTVTFRELLISNNAQTDVLAKLFIEKGIVTQKEFLAKVAEERSTRSRDFFCMEFICFAIVIPPIPDDSLIRT